MTNDIPEQASRNSAVFDSYEKRIYEPNLYKACCNVFADSYEYTRQYREFIRMNKHKGGNKK